MIYEIGKNLDNVCVSVPHMCEPEECSSLLAPSQSSQLNIITQNIRSIAHNIDGFSALLQRIVVEPDVIVLTECWLSCQPSIPQIHNYNSIASTRNFNQNDGLVVFTKSNFSYNVYEPSFLEANCLVITIKTSIAIISLYRPPSFKNLDNFLMSLDKVLLSLEKFQNVIVIGDINIDIKADSIDRHANNYLNLTASHGLLPGHTLPTRNSNCLDHVMLKTKLTSTTLVIQNSLTDHDTVLVSLLTKTLMIRPQTCYKKTNFANIAQQLKITDFLPILNLEDCDIAAELLVTQVSQIIKANTASIKIPRRKAPLKPWITPGLVRCMRNRDKMNKKLKKDPSNIITKTTYVRYRNFLSGLLRKLKRQYERSQIQKAKNVKELWQVINKIANRNPVLVNSSELLNISSTPIEASNTVNRYFASVGKTLALKITANSTRNWPTLDSTFLTQSPVSSFSILETDLNEVISIINSLKLSNTAGQDHISTRIIKDNKIIFAGLMVHICNLALNSGRFPKAFKTSVIIPIHKSGPKDVISNYRPISLLPSFSKILESIINRRLSKYLEERNLLSQQQFGFRRNKSTSDAVGELTDHVVRSLDNGDKCLAVFLDLAKAFDTVSIPLLIQKLEALGVRGSQLSLFKDYLTERNQRVKLGEDILSDPEKVTYGIPQGSTLGPTLFLIYINELCNLKIKNAKIVSFADDTAIIFHGESWERVFLYAQKGFDQMNVWLNKNMLSLNTDKTKIVTFSIKTNLKPPISACYNIKAHCYSDANLCNLNICNCNTLERVDSVRYLGVIIDCHLNFSCHIKALTSRIRKLIAVFKNIRHAVDKSTLRITYFALCQSLLMYCVDVWGGAAKSHMIALERAQRAVLKVSNYLPYRYPTSTLFAETDVLTVRQIFVLRTILQQHKLSHLNRCLELGESKRTRRRTDKVFCVPRFRTFFANRFRCFLGSFLYNKLSKMVPIQHLNNFQLKKSITRLLKACSYDETEDLLLIQR